ncbi:MAG: hypothetical protein V4632_14905 [Pseudomonadota bacterium]
MSDMIFLARGDILQRGPGCCAEAPQYGCGIQLLGAKMVRALILDKFFQSIIWYLIKNEAEFSASDHQAFCLLIRFESWNTGLCWKMGQAHKKNDRIFVVLM